MNHWCNDVDSLKPITLTEAFLTLTEGFLTLTEGFLTLTGFSYSD